MIQEIIRKIVEDARKKGESPLFIRSLLKEYFQILVLYFIYTNNSFKSNLIFTGGTCIKHFYGLERLSEDLDFDFIEYLDSKDLLSRIMNFFEVELQYKDMNASLKQQGRQILLKFPILKNLGLATQSESDFLYIKCDLEKAQEVKYTTIKSTKSAFGYNFVALHYDLESLFAGKIAAILTRNLLTDESNIQTIKGRVFYDLMWYLKREASVNFELLKAKLNEKSITPQELKDRVIQKVMEATSTFKTDFKNDLMPFISNTGFLSDYVDNYYEEFSRYELKLV